MLINVNNALRFHVLSLLSSILNTLESDDAFLFRVFLDRDGVLFRYILDFLRDGSLILPDCFRERKRLKREAEKYGLQGLVDLLESETKARPPGVITVGYRGSFQFGKDGLADVKFRKLSRILVSGRVQLCRDVFGETLNESRDPDHGITERYTSR